MLIFSAYGGITLHTHKNNAYVCCVYVQAHVCCFSVHCLFSFNLQLNNLCNCNDDDDDDNDDNEDDLIGNIILKLQSTPYIRF